MFLPSWRPCNSSTEECSIFKRLETLPSQRYSRSKITGGKKLEEKGKNWSSYRNYYCNMYISKRISWIFMDFCWLSLEQTFATAVTTTTTTNFAVTKYNFIILKTERKVATFYFKYSVAVFWQSQCTIFVNTNYF